MTRRYYSRRVLALALELFLLGGWGVGAFSAAARIDLPVFVGLDTCVHAITTEHTKRVRDVR
jgi:hypothetical protein